MKKKEEIYRCWKCGRLIPKSKINAVNDFTVKTSEIGFWRAVILMLCSKTSLLCDDCLKRHNDRITKRLSRKQ